jgi:uncharacterized protein (TIGR01777 family)
MRILVSGSHGLIGAALCRELEKAGHDLARLVRARGGEPGVVFWDPEHGRLQARDLEGMDAIVHLAGESIARRRWSAAHKERIRHSRVAGTRLLVETIGRLERPPRVFVSASAIGYYGDRGEETMQEEHEAGRGFIADVCQAWEDAAMSAARPGLRVVCLRFGMVLAAHGGPLQQMLLPFRFGLGGIAGDGRHYMSWIALDDAVGVIIRAILTKTLAGPVNAVSPHPVRNAEFTRVLGRVLGTPTPLRMPAPVLRLLFGEIADEVILASQRVEPIRLIATGYRFRYPDLEAALRRALGKPELGAQASRLQQSRAA